MAEVNVERVSRLCEELNTQVGFNQIDTDCLINNLNGYCYITRSIPIFRNNHVDVVLDLSNSEVFIETREGNILIDFILLKRLNQIYDLVEEYNDMLE